MRLQELQLGRRRTIYPSEDMESVRDLLSLEGDRQGQSMLNYLH
jgi:hypothetical protein